MKKNSIGLKTIPDSDGKEPHQESVSPLPSTVSQRYTPWCDARQWHNCIWALALPARVACGAAGDWDTNKHVGHPCNLWRFAAGKGGEEWRWSMQRVSERQGVSGKKLSPMWLINSAGKKRQAYGIVIFLQACITPWIPVKQQSKQCGANPTEFSNCPEPSEARLALCINLQMGIFSFLSC